MTRSALVWKWVLIVAVTVIAVAFSYPPGERINLGLDLRGGSHIVLQVDPASALKFQLDRTVSYLGARLEEEGLVYEAIVPAGRSSVELRGTDPAQREAVRGLLDEAIGAGSGSAEPWQVEDSGGGTFVVTMPPEVANAYASRAIDNTISILRRRIDALAVGEQMIQRQMLADRILVQLPGVRDVDRIKGLLTERASLEWKEVSYPPGTPEGAMRGWVPPTSHEETVRLFPGGLPDDTEIATESLPGGEQRLYWPLKRVSAISGNELRNAYRSNDEFGAPAVSFELEPDAGARFERITTQNLFRRMAIVLDGEVISAPVIQGKIRDQGIIQGSFDFDEAEDLALKLRSGTMETSVQIVEERTVGPSLGRDSIRAGLAAGIVGFAAVLLFMVIYYRASGVNAVVALALNVVLTFGALGALPFLFALGGLRATLTLPGIAGLILTVGMAVDSNVLVFERIREELRLGKTVRAAVDQGFSKAFLTILDCHVTTLISAFFLFFYGTGTPVQGFAVTLSIGLIISMFTAVFVSRQIFELVLLRNPRAETLSV
jgi:preprotein translocase subunit SecD